MQWISDGVQPQTSLGDLMAMGDICKWREKEGGKRE